MEIAETYRNDLRRLLRRFLFICYVIFYLFHSKTFCFCFPLGRYKQQILRKNFLQGKRDQAGT